MKNLYLSLILFILSIYTIHAQNDDDSKFTVSIRGLNVLLDEGDKIEDGDLTIPNSYGLEMDLSYYINKNLAIELGVACSKHKTLIQYFDHDKHRYDIGDVRMIPINLNLQYHFYLNKFKPYLGAGINYSFFAVKKNGILGGVNGGEFESSLGFSLQGGINYEINNKWFVNFDVKKLFLSTDMKMYHGWCGSKAKAKAIPCADYNVEEIIEKVDLNPLSIGLGIGYKFNW